MLFLAAEKDHELCEYLGEQLQLYRSQDWQNRLCSLSPVLPEGIDRETLKAVQQWLRRIEREHPLQQYYFEFNKFHKDNYYESKWNNISFFLNLTKMTNPP